MQNISVLVAALAVCVGALGGNFAYVPRDVLPRFQAEQEKSIYFLDESKQPNNLCSVYFRCDAKDNCVPSPVSLLRFVYDETEAKTRYPNARDIAEEVAGFIADHVTVDTERKLFFVSFADEASPVQAVPEGVAEVSVLGPEENNIDYIYKKEREHGNIFDRFLAAEECKREDKEKRPRIKNIPAKRKETIFLLSFLATKGFQLDLEAAPSMHGEEGSNWGLKLPYGVSLFVSEESSCCLELFDLTDTRIKRLEVSSFDITEMDLKNTHIEELVLVDEAALAFFYDSMERCEFYVEKVSFGNNLKKKSEKFLKLIERVHGGEITAPRKIKALVLNRNSFFCFLEEARRISQRKIHVEDLGIIQSGKDTGPGTETSTRIVVSQKIRIRGNARVLLFIELGPELSHLNIDEIQRQCRSPRIYIPKINIQLTESKIRVRENLHVLQFFKKNITAAEMDFFTTTGKKTLWSTKITLAVGEMESICFGRKGLSALSRITNEKVDVRHMAVMDIMSFFEQEEARKKEFVIRERLYVRNTGILFLECLRNTVFIPAIEIEVDCCMEYWGGFGKTTGIHIETNALVGSISPGIEDLWGIKQTIREIVTQKKVVVKNEAGYPKLVFEEDSKHGEQNEAGESEEQPITGCQTFKDFIKEYFGRYEEQRETEDSREQPSVESKMFDEVFKELYSLLQRSLDMHNPEDSDCLQEEEVVNPFWNLFLEHRSQYLCRLGLHALR